MKTYHQTIMIYPETENLHVSVQDLPDYIAWSVGKRDMHGKGRYRCMQEKGLGFLRVVFGDDDYDEDDDDDDDDEVIFSSLSFPIQYL